MATDFELVLLDSVTSTQKEAQQRWLGDPVVVIAAHQSEGRGRRGNQWVSADRALAVSVTTGTTLPVHDRGVLAPIAGLAAHQVLAESGYGELSIKWPNDLLDPSSRKVAGVLVESDQRSVTVGLGVNFWTSAELVPGAGWLSDVDPGEDAPRRVGIAWAAAFLASASVPFDREAFVDRCSTIGHPITWHPSGSGMAVDVATDGRLVVDTQTGVTLLSASEVNHVRGVEGE